MLKIEKDDRIYPFSKGILAWSILSTGLSVETAYDIVKEVQQGYQSEKEPVSSSDIRNKVVQILDQKGLIKEKNRYLISWKIEQIEKPLVILIAGVAGIGKSTIATELAKRIGIRRVIDTDEIREIMRYTLPEDLLPELHKSSFDADEIITELNNQKNELLGFSRQARLVNRGVRAYVKRVSKEGIKTIFNGVHLVPGLMEMEQNDNSVDHFNYLLTLQNKEDHIRRFNSRAKHSFRRAERYIEKIDQIRNIQEYTIKKAEESGTKIIENTSLEGTVTEIVDDLIDNLQEK